MLKRHHRTIWVLIGFSLLLLLLASLTTRPAVSGPENKPAGKSRPDEVASGPPAGPANPPPEPNAPCPGGRIIDGLQMDECFVESFSVGGTNKSVKVWYTQNTSLTHRMVDDGARRVALTHWVDTDAQAEQVAQWTRQAWERHYEMFNRHPKNCNDQIEVQLEDGVGWAGLSGGGCAISIDAPLVRGGGGQGTVFHEVQHMMQDTYTDGCLRFINANYPADSEYIEGYPDLVQDTADAALDARIISSYIGRYNPHKSMYDHGYNNVYNKYYAEQVGSQWAESDPKHHMDAVREHYIECDVQDNLYVLDRLIPRLTDGRLTQETLFMNFFAANFLHRWADESSQSELVYLDENPPHYGWIDLDQNQNISSGSLSWNGTFGNKQTWAGRYYLVKPQAGCDYVTVEVDGEAGARLGINLMAADTIAPTEASRFGWIGEDFSRTFAGHGRYDHIAAAINTFKSVHDFKVSFSCVTPTVSILEPRATNFVQVGDPASPQAFLLRFQVTNNDGSPIRGLTESSFQATAGGDAVTVVPGSFLEIGEEYWAIMRPPVKPPGTTFVGLTLCLDNTYCAIETNALRYVDPGHTDFALVFDASWSMNTEDVPGEGRRYENAQKAGTVLADLLRNDDRVLVLDFSADGSSGCPPNCTLDIRTLLPRTTVVVPGTITATKNAIAQITPRVLTPIGAALQEGKNQLVAAPGGNNPKVMILLSDGQQNVNPYYAAVKQELQNSGVVIDTIAFSSEADAPLMAQIAADTGGSYRFVPTTAGTVASLSVEEENEIKNLGLPDEITARLLTPLLPGPLALDDIYDYYETKNQKAVRLFHMNYAAISSDQWVTVTQFVDSSVNKLRLVVAGKQPNQVGDWSCGTDHRFIEVLLPGADPVFGWIGISPPLEVPVPANWDVRNSTYDDVVIISNPDVGVWKLRSQYMTGSCPAQGERGTHRLDRPTSGLYDLMLNGSVQTDARLQGFFLRPLLDQQGQAGDAVPLVAALLDRSGTITGAIVLATIEKPEDTDWLLLYDDGAHHDGEANDGIYGRLYGETNVGGSYNVRIEAFWTDPGTGNWNAREWLGSFWIQGLEGNDGDNDGLPDPWEERCGLDPSVDDSLEDPDQDGLSNIEELQAGTLPRQADTDHGGEQDASEVYAGRDPLDPGDDQVPSLGHVSTRILNGTVAIYWPYPGEYSTVYVYVSTDPNDLGAPADMGNSGVYTLTGLLNDQTYYLTLVGLGLDGYSVGDYVTPIEVTPRTDPDAPNGAVLIDGGADSTSSPLVTLSISAIDDPLPGKATPGGGAMANPLNLAYNDVSGVTEMKISNDPALADASWEPLASEKGWTLGTSDDDFYWVYAQFRDAAGNESVIVADSIQLIWVGGNQLYLPLLLKNDR